MWTFLSGQNVSRWTRLGGVTATLLTTALVFAAGTSQAWHQLPAGVAGLRDAGYPAIRGITVGPVESSQQPDRGYGSGPSRVLLEHVSELSSNWVSLTPFGRIWSLSSSTVHMDFEAPYEGNRSGLKAMIRAAHEQGLRVVVVPHLWVEAGGWRGELAPDNREAFFRSYRRFVLRWAKTAQEAGADAFSIGVECTSWSDREGPVWSALIRELRRVFKGLLTYSANWDEVEQVLFWDQLDFVGINAFYPLANAHVPKENERLRQYRKGAEQYVADLGQTAATLGMPIVFMELGYTSRPSAAIEPWLWPDGMDSEAIVVDEVEQRIATQAMLDTFLPKPWFGGFFLWRYYANLDDVSQEGIWGFSPHGKETEGFLRARFADRLPGDPPRWNQSPDPR